MRHCSEFSTQFVINNQSVLLTTIRTRLSSPHLLHVKVRNRQASDLLGEAQIDKRIAGKADLQESATLCVVIHLAVRDACASAEVLHRATAQALLVSHVVCMAQPPIHCKAPQIRRLALL